MAQAESRAHRIGQTNPVTCRYLMATKTADDHIWHMLKNKQDTLNKAGLFCDNLQDATHTVAPITVCLFRFLFNVYFQLVFFSV